MILFYYLRSFLFTFFFFPVVTVVLSISGILSVLILRHRRHIDWCSFNWAKLCMWGLNAKVEVKGQENIPAGACLFLFNHTSFVDIFALTSQVPSLRFGAKIELFSIPFFGAALRLAGALPIARQKREHAIRILTEAENRARNGERFALAPEGGRNYEEQLLPFKSGPFIFAIKTEIPIVPVVILGAKQVWKKNALLPATDQWGYKVTVEYLKPFATTGYTVEQRSQLAEKVRDSMLPYFQKSV
jgi:1-acyl-sn-glycerol-3-phosphate acyltransferase